jgi:sortase system peptidoglycan-associated protein
MKKSLLNMSLTLALSAATISASVLPMYAYANDPGSTDTSNTDTSNIEDDKTSSDNYVVPGIGAGALAGTLIAGPVGLVIGGLIGGFVGSSQDDSSDMQSSVANNDELSADEQLNQSEDSSDNSSIENIKLAEEKADLASIQVAQLGSVTLPKNNDDIQHDEIMDIITGDLSLDIYFRSGSTDIEAFYPARLDAIANLINSMDQLEIQLDGYTDRRGNKEKNIQLANQRIENVRQQLIRAGVDENRIISQAHGEMKMVSSPGDLEAYTFDRKVVISFVRSDADSLHSMTSALSALENEVFIAAKSDTSEAPIVAETSIAF